MLLMLGWGFKMESWEEVQKKYNLSQYQEGQEISIFRGNSSMSFTMDENETFDNLKNNEGFLKFVVDYFKKDEISL